MSVTIRNLIHKHNARDAQRILSNIIRKLVADEAWKPVIEAAKRSLLINTTHTNSRTMKSVSISQILDRMSAHANALLLVDVWLDRGLTSDKHLWKLVQYFEGDDAYVDSITCWPYAPSQEEIDLALDHDITDQLDLSDDVEPVQDEATTKTADTPTSPTAYDVSADIAVAANVLLKAATGGEMDDLQKLLDEVVDLRNRPTSILPPKVQADGDIPEGTPVRVNALDVFSDRDTSPMSKEERKLMNMDITTYVWDGVHPLVPAKDPNYIFNWSHVSDVLWAIENGDNSWLTGSTGTGKSTLAEQIASWTGRMIVRVNMDSAIERPDFVGAMALVSNEDGSQVTMFKDGVLPRAMQLPCILLLDEYDAVRPDIAYVMQPVLEGAPLRLLEDGGRMVHPHADFHIIATANTTGTGDSSGMYAAAVKVQSRAQINRFSVFIKVDYMETHREMDLIKKFAPDVSQRAMGLLQQFIEYYRKGFTDGTIATPISPRNTITLGRYLNTFEGKIGTKTALKRALQMNVMLTIDEQDAIAVTGIMDRVCA